MKRTSPPSIKRNISGFFSKLKHLLKSKLIEKRTIEKIEGRTCAVYTDYPWIQFLRKTHCLITRKEYVKKYRVSKNEIFPELFNWNEVGVCPMTAPTNLEFHLKWLPNCQKPVDN